MEMFNVGGKRGSKQGKKEEEEEEERLYCICRKPYSARRPMIGCDGCDDWFHTSCVGISTAKAENMPMYICPSCLEKGVTPSAVVTKPGPKKRGGGRGSRGGTVTSEDEKGEAKEAPAKGRGGRKRRLTNPTDEDNKDADEDGEGAPKRKAARKDAASKVGGRATSVPATAKAREERKAPRAVAQKPVVEKVEMQQAAARFPDRVTAVFLQAPPVNNPSSLVHPQTVHISSSEPDQWHRLVTNSEKKAMVKGHLQAYRKELGLTIVYMAAADAHSFPAECAYQSPNVFATQLRYYGEGQDPDRNPTVFGNALVISCDERQPSGMTDLTMADFHRMMAKAQEDHVLKSLQSVVNRHHQHMLEKYQQAQLEQQQQQLVQQHEQEQQLQQVVAQQHHHQDQQAVAIEHAQAPASSEAHSAPSAPSAIPDGHLGLAAATLSAAKDTTAEQQARSEHGAVPTQQIAAPNAGLSGAAQLSVEAAPQAFVGESIAFPQQQQYGHMWFQQPSEQQL